MNDVILGEVSAVLIARTDITELLCGSKDITLYPAAYWLPYAEWMQ
jgi:hypothetical protein